MRRERVRFFSEGTLIEAMVYRPRESPAPAGYPVILHAPGFLGLADMPTALMYDDLFVGAGFAVVGVNYRGFGRSGGARGWVLPERQLEDLINALTYIQTVSDLDASCIGVYGQGGTGGGNAIMLAAVDERICCVASQSPIADGGLWLESMRRPHEWNEFCRRVAENARRRVVSGTGASVDPREEIMISTPDRRTHRGGSMTDLTVGSSFQLASVEHLFRYRPVDFVARISPRPILLISLVRDSVTPADLCAERLFEAALPPKMLVRQNVRIAHYASYARNIDVIGPALVDFFRQHLCGAPACAE